MSLRGFNRMKLSFVCTLGLALVGAVAGTSAATALDATHPLHRSRTSQPHLTETHRSTSHHAVAHSSIAARTHTAATNSPARLTPRGQARANARQVALLGRRHHFYERFTASSFASSDQFAGDITA